MNDAGGELPSFTTTHGEKKAKDLYDIHPKWSQKSSWRELLGDKTESSFSVKHLLTGAGSIMDEEIEPDDQDIDVPGSVDSEDHELDTDSDAPDPVEVEDHDLIKHSDVSNSVDAEDSGFSNQEILGGQIDEFSESKGAVEVQMKESNAASSSNLGRGASWLHKSSWTQLVASNQNHSFSLSQMWSSEDNKAMPDHGDDTPVADNEQWPDEPPNALVTGKEEVLSASFSVKEPKTPVSQDTVGSNPGNSHKQEEKGLATTDRVSLGIGEECLFMRSSASLRDWANSKTALTRSRKRKKP